MKKNKTAFFIILTGFIFRLIYLFCYKDNFFNWDELFPLSMSTSCSSYIELIKTLALEDCHPPMFVIISRFFAFLGDDRFLMLRLMNVIFSTLNMIIFYFLIKKISQKLTITNISLLLMAVSPWMLKESVLVFRYTTFFTFVLLNMLSFYNCIKKTDRKNSFFYITATLLCFYTHYFSLFVVLPQVIYVFLDRKKVDSFFNSYLIITILYLPFLLLSHSSPLNVNFYQKTLKGSIGWLVPVDFSDFVLEMLKNFLLYDFSISRHIIGSFLLLVIVYGFYKSDKIVRTIFFIPPVLLLLTAAGYQLIFGQGLIEFNHFVFSLPLFFYSLAVFIEEVLKKAFLPILVAIFILVSISHLIVNRGGMFEIFAEDILKEYADQNTMVYIFPNYYFINAQYYMKDFPGRVRMIPLTVDLDDIEVSFEDEFYNKRLFFLRNMEGESLHHGDFKILKDYLDSREGVLKFSLDDNVALVYLHPAERFNEKEIKMIAKKPLSVTYLLLSIAKAVNILLAFILISGIYQILIKLFKKKKNKLWKD